MDANAHPEVETCGREKLLPQAFHPLLHCQGSHPCESLQAAWTAHGSDSLAFEECERLEEEDTPYIRDALLKELEDRDHVRELLDAFADIHRNLRRAGAARAAEAILECIGRRTDAATVTERVAGA